MDSYTRRIPFPYSFGSRVGYYSIRCYLAPISVSPISKALGILRVVINPYTIPKVGRTIQQFACCFAVRIGLVVWLVVSVEFNDYSTIAH